MAVIDVDGVNVSYQVDGNGPGLVLVHGTGADGESNWGHLAILEGGAPRLRRIREDRG